jgi:mRNA-degrading endonuclease RelE of RelBE toxin-antitoxin system
MLTFIETKLFSRLADEFLPDDELARLQHHLNENPQAGDLIRESGGVRKLRWGAMGRGKRGGLRIIYYLRSKQGEIWLLYAVCQECGGEHLRISLEEDQGGDRWLAGRETSVVKFSKESARSNGVSTVG